MQQDVHLKVAEEVVEVMVVSEGVVDPSPQGGICFGSYFIIR